MIKLFLNFLLSSFKSRQTLALENIAIRHQLEVLQRNAKRPRLATTPDHRSARHGHPLASSRLATKEQTTGVVFSDAHKSYPRAIRETACEISHIVTSSKDHRDRNNNLWEMNLTDLLIRHGSANHKRETIAWSKRRQSSAERLAIFLVSRNYIKGRRAKDGSSPTPAMARGMLDRRLKVEDILEERIFRDHVIILNERHLRQVLKKYFAYYHESRTHLGLEKDAPEPRVILPPELGPVISEPVLGG